MIIELYDESDNHRTAVLMVHKADYIKVCFYIESYISDKDFKLVNWLEYSIHDLIQCLEDTEFRVVEVFPDKTFRL